MRDKAIASARKRLQKAGLARVVVKRSSNLPDAEIQALLEINKGPLTPDLLANLRPGYDLSCAADKHLEHPKWLRLQANGLPGPSKFFVAEIDFVIAEADQICMI